MRNILFAGNYRVFDGILTCVLSILMRTQAKEPFRFFLFTMDVSHLKPEYLPITDQQTKFLQRVAASYNPENQVIKVDVTELYKKEFSGCPNEVAYCSPYTLIRLLADQVEGIPDRLLYLDADLLFQRDIRLLYDQDLTGYEYAAARDHYGKYLLNPNYINAGVLLFQMDEVRKTGLLRKARELLRAKKWTFADQDALYHSTTRKKMLPQRFNDQKFLHKHTVVRHFSKRLFWTPYPHTANIKQWMVDEVHRVFRYHQFDDILTKYLALKQEFEKETMRK